MGWFVPMPAQFQHQPARDDDHQSPRGRLGRTQQAQHGAVEMARQGGAVGNWQWAIGRTNGGLYGFRLPTGDCRVPVPQSGHGHKHRQNARQRRAMMLDRSIPVHRILRPVRAAGLWGTDGRGWIDAGKTVSRC
ncbi:hypothetical protein [Neoaquamicrobium sediminum]|uniref:hypothetical protein n=1 Tax=Neoaquamicrobium sediminum TaxID=1849104 RepID=UPI003BA96D84